MKNIVLGILSVLGTWSALVFAVCMLPACQEPPPIQDPMQSEWAIVERCKMWDEAIGKRDYRFSVSEQFMLFGREPVTIHDDSTHTVAYFMYCTEKEAHDSIFSAFTARYGFTNTTVPKVPTERLIQGRPYFEKKIRLKMHRDSLPGIDWFRQFAGLWHCPEKNYIYDGDGSQVWPEPNMEQ